MNILFLDQYSESGGAQLCLLELLPAVRERGWKAHVAAPGDGPLLRTASADSVDVIHFGPFTSGRKTPADALRFAAQLPGLRREIASLVKRHAIDLLYVNGPRMLTAAASQSVPMLFHCHSRLRGLEARLAGRALRASGATVVAACRHVAEPLWRYTELEIVYNGVGQAVSPAQRRASEAACPTRIGVVGRIHPHKGQREFIRAARLLAPRFPDRRFLIFGSALFSDPAAVRYAESLQPEALGLPVEFRGWQDRGVYSELDLVVVPSLLNEATPRVILEAFSAGVPVVAFATGGIPELIEDGENGFLATPSTAIALADSIAALLERPERMRRAADAAFEVWQKRFTPQAHQQRMLGLMVTAVRRRAGLETPQRPAAP